MNNFIEYIENLQSSLEKKEERKRQTGRSTKIIDQARKNGSTVVCLNYRQKQAFEHFGGRFITIEQYHKEKYGSSKKYLFDHCAIHRIIQDMLKQLASNYGK